MRERSAPARRMPRVLRQREVFGAGLTIPWSEIPPDLQRMNRRLATRVQGPEACRSFRASLRCVGDRREITREWPTRSIHDMMELILPAEPADDLRRWVGRPLPELEAEGVSGKTERFRTRGPALLYVTPAWPRPVVTRREMFADLKALDEMGGTPVLVLGTGATAAELRAWWKERGLGTGQQPLAVVGAVRGVS